MSEPIPTGLSWEGRCAQCGRPFRIRYSAADQYPEADADLFEFAAGQGKCSACQAAISWQPDGLILTYKAARAFHVPRLSNEE